MSADYRDRECTHTHLSVAVLSLDNKLFIVHSSIKYFWLVKMLVTWSESGCISDKREAKRWKAKLHRRSFFRTSNRMFLAAVSRAPGGRSCNFLAERGWTCGHYSADIKDARPREHWHTLFRSLSVTSLLLSVSFCPHFSGIHSPHLSLAGLYR